MLNYPRAAQCITLPSNCRGYENLRVSDIFPTHDHKHILVALKDEKTNISFLILYQIDFSDSMCKIVEEPVLLRQLEGYETPKDITLLPSMDKFPSTSKMNVIGNVVMVSVDGAVRIVNLETLKVVCYGKINSEKFISAVYCNSKYCNIFHRNLFTYLIFFYMTNFFYLLVSSFVIC